MSKHWITDWNPESPDWETTGRSISRRNLIFSIFADNVGFSVWLLWSIIAVNLNQVGFHFSKSELFWMVALPNLIGSFLRLPYSYAVTRFGGRNWTLISSLLLLIPTALLALTVTNPSTPYWVFLVVAATAGFGGGSFSASMTNINFFYPERCKGMVLGLNAAGGNLGVSVVQSLVPILIVAGGGLHLERAGYVWGALAALAALFAWTSMDNLAIARSPFKDQFSAIEFKETWIMSFLYIGTFGSFIGYSAAMPLLIKTQFPEIAFAKYAFLGGLLGALARPFGGWLSDKIGGAAVTFWNFLAMAIGVALVTQSLKMHDFTFFLCSFLFLFITAGVGNGSTYRMIPAIFRQQAMIALAETNADAEHTILARARSRAGAVIGIAAAIGAFGGFLIPLSYGCFGVIPAFYGFLAYYIACLATTWFCFIRKPSTAAKLTSLAEFRV